MKAKLIRNCGPDSLEIDDSDMIRHTDISVRRDGYLRIEIHFGNKKWSRRIEVELGHGEVDRDLMIERWSIAQERERAKKPTIDPKKAFSITPPVGKKRHA